jgi:hypothetical protein
MQTPSANPGFTLAPLGSQQFYQMAQHHAMVNAAYPPAMPNYVPMMNDELYPAMHMQAPQYLPQQANAAALGMPEVLWSPYYGNTELVPQHYELDPRAFAMHQHAMPLNGNQDQMNAATAAHLSAPLAASSSNAPSSPQPSSSSEPSERISDEPFPDDHKWRKYGQKQVKRSPYPRNYYKCTISGCPANKHLEKFWDAAANKERCRTIYIGEHVHPVAISPQVYAATQADFRNSVLAQSTKIRELSLDSNDVKASADLSAQQRLVVECGTQVDENDDGYFWRKYGQKSVKGSSMPRQYYRCRNENCMVKKTVEASPKGNVIVTYDGPHCHEAGVAPEIAHASAGQSASVAASQLPEQRPQQANVVAPTLVSSATMTAPLRLTIRREAPSAVASSYVDSYPSEVESPSSTLSTTDDDDSTSYFSEPSPKRFKDEDVIYDDALHHYDASAPRLWFYEPQYAPEYLV